MLGKHRDILPDSKLSEALTQSRHEDQLLHQDILHFQLGKIQYVLDVIRDIGMGPIRCEMLLHSSA